MSETPTVLGQCRYCGENIQRGISHACENSEFEFACEPYYVVDTAGGFALRDSRSRCIGELTFRKWMSRDAKERARDVISDVFNRGG